MLAAGSAGNHGRLLWYGVAVFLSSGLLLALEILAGRLIAPYVGVSLYSWTSVIGVVLAGVSLGNWLGGRWADRGAADREAGLALVLAGLASLNVLLMLTLAAPLIQSAEIGLLAASVAYAVALFFLPSVCLGLISPMLTTLALRLDARAGHVVGRMHALAALGSILGTFVTGFFLIQYFGTQKVIVACALMLLALSLPFFARRAAPILAAALLAAGLLAMAIALRGGFATPCQRESQYYCIRVDDISERMPRGNARVLVLDHLMHGTNHAQVPELILAPYAHLQTELAAAALGARAASARYFFAGGGAYTQPRALRALTPGAVLTVAELDPAVTAVAESLMWVDTSGIEVLHEDARVALAGLEVQFDVVVGDVFHDIALPYHLTTREFATLVHARLSPGGLYVLNVVDAFPDPRLVKSLVKTLNAVFARVDVWLERMPETPTRLTYVLTATDTASWPDELESTHGLPRRWGRVTDTLLDTGTPIATLPLLTDDYVPVERLVSSLLIGRLGEQ